MNFLYLLITSFLLTSTGASLTSSGSKTHPIHASICELRYNEGESSFQVSVKIFIDDLEVAIKQEGYPPLNLGSDKENEDAKTHLAAYLDRYFQIVLDGKKLEARFSGKELSDDYLAVWCYLEFPAAVSRGQKCTITNRVLLDLYSDQRNIMDIKMSTTQSTHTIFDPSDSSWSYTF
ncbi:MAG: DUF6702 family protein [Saprospiraceae bacterium]